MPKCVSPGSEAAGAWASWAALGQPRGPAAKYSSSAAPTQSHSGSPFFIQVESFIHLSIPSFIKHLSFQYIPGIISGAEERAYRARGVKSLGSGIKTDWVQISSPSSCSLCEPEQGTLLLCASVPLSAK